MTATAKVRIDQKKYGRLLSRTLPMVIETEEENERMLGAVEQLMAKGEENLTPEESRLFKLMVRLIEDFEASLTQSLMFHRMRFYNTSWKSEACVRPICYRSSPHLDMSQMG